MAQKSKFSGMFDAIPDAMPIASERGQGRVPGLRSNPEYKQCSHFLHIANTKRARRILENQYDEKDLSVLLNELIAEWLQRHST